MPIPFEQKIIAVLFSLILLLVTLQLIRTHKLREEYALIWFGVSLAIFTFSIFDRLNIFLARALDVSYAPTLILVFGLLFCIVILLSQTVVLSTQANRIRDLAQCIGMLECKIAELEQGTAHASAHTPGDPEVAPERIPEAPLREEQKQSLSGALAAEL